MCIRDSYYDALMADPVLWHPGSARWAGWRDLVGRGLMASGGWD